jgi:hypothetical protein
MPHATRFRIHVLSWIGRAVLGIAVGCGALLLTAIIAYGLLVGTDLVVVSYSTAIWAAILCGLLAQGFKASSICKVGAAGLILLAFWGLLGFERGRVDVCLDSGGAWDRERRQCER